MTQQNAPVGEPLDERTLARKYGLRELVWPDTEQVKALSAFLAGAVATGKCGLVPKMAVKVMLIIPVLSVILSFVLYMGSRAIVADIGREKTPAAVTIAISEQSAP